MTETWLYSLVPVTVIVGLSIIARLLSGSWTHPATLFSSVWAAHTLLTVVFAPDLPLYPSGLWFIAIACLSVQCGAFLIAPPARARISAVARARMRSQLQSVVLRPLTIMIIILLPIAIISAFFTIDDAHRSLNSLTSVQNIARLANASTAVRYSSRVYSPNLVVQFFSSAIFLAPTLGGIVYALRRNRWDTLIALGAFLPALFVTATQSTKAGTLFSMMLWVAAYLGCTEFCGRRPSRKKITLALMWMALGIPALIGVSEALRNGEVPTMAQALTSVASGRVKVMAFGHMYAFTQWFDESYESMPAPTFGSYTFAGPANLMGISSRGAGVIPEFRQVEEYRSSTNIYTYFRHFTEDFTLLGSLVLFVFAGALGGWGYRGIRLGLISRVAWITIYNASVFNYFGSLFIYNSVGLGAVLFALLWWFLTTATMSKQKIDSRTARSPA